MEGKRAAVLQHYYCQHQLGTRKFNQCRKKTHRCGKDCGDDQLHLEGGLNLVDAPSRLQVSGNQSGEQADQDSDS